jgi:plastocyanin
VLLAVTAVAAALALPALASNDAFPAIEVTIHPHQGGEEHVWLNELDESDLDVDSTFFIREPGKEPRSVQVERGRGVFVWKVLAERSRETGYGYLEVTRPDGSVISIPPDEVTDPKGAVFYVGDDGTVRFLRPSQTTDDYNGRDHFRVQGSAVGLELTPPDLDVRVSPKEKKVEVGDSVSLSMKVVNGPSVAYDYSWNFDDGDTDSGRAVTHTFTKSGRYQVLATAEVASDSTHNGSAVAEITVGDPKESSMDQVGGGSSTGTADSGTYGGVGSPYGGTSSSTSPTTPSTPTPTPSVDPQSPPSIATTGTTVAGNLLADVSAPVPSNILESAAKAAREGTPKDDDEADGATVPEAVVSIVALLLLLTLGAAMEERQDWRLRRAAKAVG